MLEQLAEIWGHMAVMAFIAMFVNMAIRRKLYWDLKLGAFFSFTIWIPHLVMVFWMDVFWMDVFWMELL